MEKTLGCRSQERLLSKTVGVREDLNQLLPYADGAPGEGSARFLIQGRWFVNAEKELDLES